MKINHRGNGKIEITGDEKLLAKIEGQSLEGIDISDIRVDADNLSELYVKACASSDNLEHVKRYAVMKKKYLEAYSAK